MLDQAVAIGNIANSEAFVEAAVQKVARRHDMYFTAQEKEELLADGLAILWKLYTGFRPRMNGHKTDGEFSGYAAAYLPGKLGDAWHRRHPTHLRHTHSDRNSWEYLPEPDDLADHADNGLHTAGGLDDPLILLNMPTPTITVASLTSRFARNVGSAIRSQLSDEHAFTIQVAVLRGLDYHKAQIVETLGRSELEVQMALVRLHRVGENLLADPGETEAA